MKRKLLSMLVLLFCVMGGVQAKDVYEWSLGEELTLEQVKDGTTPFVLARVSDGKILVYGTSGNMASTKTPDEAGGVSEWAFYFKMEGIAGNQTYEDNLTTARNAEENAFDGEAANDDLYLFRVYANTTTPWNLWGNNEMFISHCGWTLNSNSLNGAKFGSDAYYNAIWKITEETDGYSIQSQSQGNKNYLSGSDGPGAKTSWKFYASLKSKKVGHTTFDLTKISFEDAKISTHPVVMIQNDLVLCNSNGGANYSTKEDFDEFAYWVKFEEYSAKDNQYYITLNKEDGSRVNYLNASEWSHIFLSGVDKEGTRGEKQNGAVFTIADLGNNKYSIRNLGAVEGAYGEEYLEKGYVNFTTSDYWANNATWQHTTPGEWEFYTVTNKKDVLDDPEPESEDYKELPISDLVATGSATVNGEVIDMTNGGGAKWQYDTPQNWSAYKYLVITPKRRFVTSEQKEGGADAERTAVQVSINGKSLQWIGKWNPKRLWVLDLTTTIEGLDLTTVTDKITSVEIHYGDNDKGEWSLSAAYLTNTKPTYSESLYNHDAGALGDAETNADHVRTLSATGTLGVVCLPYASAICGADAYEFVGVNDTENPTAIWVKPVTGILTAGKPYVFKTNTNLNVTFYKAGANTVAEAGSENGLVGVFADTPVSGNNYAVSAGKFKKAGEYTATVKANRAYLDIANAPVYTDPSSVKGCINLYDENEADAIQSIIKPANEGAIYDLSGRRVSNAKAGLYIVNGKKVVLK